MGGPIAAGSKSLILRIPVLVLVFLSISFWIWVSGPVRIGGIGIPERRLPPECVFRPWSYPFYEADVFQVFLWNVVTGQFGCSAINLKPVWDEILPHLGGTLGLTAMTVAAWGLIGAALALPTWKRSASPVSNSFARQAFWFALLAGLLPGILLVWIRLGLPLFSSVTEWIWNAPPPHNTLLFPVPILIAGLAIVGIPVNLWFLLSDNSPPTRSSNPRVRRLLLPLARTNFSIVLSTVVLAEMIMASVGYGFGLGGRLYIALGWRDITQLVAMFYLLFAGAVVGNYIVDMLAFRMGLAFVAAHSATEITAGEGVRKPDTMRVGGSKAILAATLILVVASSPASFLWPLGVSQELTSELSGQLLIGLYNTVSSVSGPALLASILSLAFVAILRKLGRKNSGLLASLLSDSALSVPILPMIFVGFMLDLEHLQRQMMAAAVIVSLVIAKGVYQEWPEGRSSPEASGRARVRSYFLLFLRVLSPALAGFTLLGFTLDSLGLFLSPSPSLGQMVYDVYREGVWSWWQYTIPTVTVIGTAIGLILFSRLLGRMPRNAVSQQTFA